MSVSINTIESIRGLTNLAELDVVEIGGRGQIYQLFTLELKARASIQHGAQPQHYVQPLRITAELYLGNQSRSDLLLALGEGEGPYNKWMHQYETNFRIGFHLTQHALKRIEDALSDPYLEVLVQLTGNGEYSAPPGPIAVQFTKVNLPVRRSAIDWKTKVLEPIGWGKFAFFSLPLPEIPRGPDFKAAVAELEQLSAQYLAGHDDGVFLHAYKAMEPFYSARSQLAARFADTAKGGAVTELIEALHRFSIGGRHALAENRQSQSFDVNHIDAECMRFLTLALICFLARHNQSQ